MSQPEAHPSTVAFIDQMDASARDMFPEKSPEWRRAYLLRLFHAKVNGGDMTGAPELPEDDE